MGCGASHQKQESEKKYVESKPPLGAPPPAWTNAPRPNYTTNTDLHYMGSEIPDITQGGFPQYGLTPVPITTTITLVDMLGQGRVVNNGQTRGMPGAYNINYEYALVTVGADAGKKVPNRIPVANIASPGTAPYVNTGVVATVMVDSANVSAITGPVLSEIVRLANPTTGQVVTFGFTLTQLSELYNALPPNYVVNTLNTDTTYAAITSTPVYFFTSQTTAIAAFNAAIEADQYEPAAGQLEAMYTNGSFNDAGQIADFVNGIPFIEIFPVVTYAAKNISADSGTWLNFVTTNVTDASLRALITSAVNGTGVQLSTINNNVGGNTVYLNGRGKGWDDTSYQCTTDPNNVRPNPVFTWYVSQGDDFQAFFRCDIDGTMYNLIAPGDEWSNGPTYWTLCRQTSASNSTMTSFVFDKSSSWTSTNSLVNLIFNSGSKQGVEWLNAQGDEWSGGPSWFVTADLPPSNPNSRGGNFNWTVGAAS